MADARGRGRQVGGREEAVCCGGAPSALHLCRIHGLGDVGALVPGAERSLSRCFLCPLLHHPLPLVQQPPCIIALRTFTFPRCIAWCTCGQLQTRLFSLQHPLTRRLISQRAHPLQPSAPFFVPDAISRPKFVPKMSSSDDDMPLLKSKANGGT
jgi:hypothetical protein